ncbi:MAG TPA: ABC transporter ATP-binding protein, partial [Deltaproteobacteria bacterium]|nr:ABC transporter ATP-binding protein [Deltaproteobacteria bacterium]
ADEPTTALDVTIQAQILRLLSELVEEENMSLILITHDLGVIAENTDRMLVMYAGRCVESGLTEDVFSKLKHPYTRGLFEALPDGEQPQAEGPMRLRAIAGRVPKLDER